MGQCSVEFLNSEIFARVLQGFTSAVEGVIVLAMISDMFDEERGIKIIGFYWVIVAIASATSPILGNSINNAFGWHYIFIFLAVVSILSAVALWRYIPDSPSKIHHSGNTSAASHVNKMLIQYKCILSIPAFIIYSTYGSIFFAVLSAFLQPQKIPVSGSWWVISLPHLAAHYLYTYCGSKICSLSILLPAVA
ncbi:MFS transporter [Eionea flava]